MLINIVLANEYTRFSSVFTFARLDLFTLLVSSGFRKVHAPHNYFAFPPPPTPAGLCSMAASGNKCYRFGIELEHGSV